jgi:predicted anti-sigma-YlaC factor YlaD
VKKSKHLTFDEMIGFLEIREINKETMKMAYRVNEHIHNCDECYKVYRALYKLFEKFSM